MKLFKHIKWIISTLIIVFFIGLTYMVFDLPLFMEQVKKILNYPFVLCGIFLTYFFSFCLKGIAWKLFLNNRPRYSTCIIGLFYSLFINHLIPLKVGDLVRVAVLAERDKHISLTDSFQSVFILRILDIFSLISISFLGLTLFKIDYKVSIGSSLIILLIITIVICMNKQVRLFLTKQFNSLKSIMINLNGLIIFLLVFTSWILEAIMLFGIALIIAHPISFLEAVWVNSMTVAGQVFQITPGGIANYEAIMSVSLKVLGMELKTGYIVAVITHGFKFIFSYVVGICVVIAFPLTYETIKRLVKERGGAV